VENSPCFTYGDSEKLSRDEFPRVVLEWPEGLSNSPVVYPMGRSLEEILEIHRLLEGLFDGRGPGPRG